MKGRGSLGLTPALLLLRLNIFRSGTHTAHGGQTVQFDDATLAAIASTYDPAVHEAPVVVGHPKLDAPAYGWVRSLSAAGADLDAEADQVEAQFAELVQDGRFKKISAAFYLPGSKGHPLGPDAEHPYLKHVGFLGAQAPAIKGLKSVEFSEHEDGVVVVEFGGYEERRVIRFMRRFRDFILAKYGPEDADRLVTSDELDWAIEDSAREEMRQERAALDPAFAEPTDDTNPDPDPMSDRTAEFAERERQLTEREERIREQEAAAAQRERERLHTEHVAFAEGLADEARILPRHVPAVAAALDTLAGDESQTVAFAEGEDEQPVGQALRQVLTELAPQVAFGEQAPARIEDEAAGVAEFAAPTGAPVDQARLAVHRKAVAYQREHGGEYLDAVRAVS